VSSSNLGYEPALAVAFNSRPLRPPAEAVVEAAAAVVDAVAVERAVSIREVVKCC
jgi:hypothetical protein